MNKNYELAKNTAIITIGKICTQFMSFILMPLYTAILTAEEYGVVDLIVTYTSLFIPIVLFQVDQALFRFLIDSRKDVIGKKKIISTAFCFAAFQAIVVIILFFFLHFFITIKFKWFLLFNILATIFANMMLQTARGFGDNISYALGSVLSASTQIFGNIIFLLFFKMGIYGMLYATIFANLLTAVFLFVRERIYRYVAFKDFNLNELKSILKYSIPLIPNALCWWVLNASDRTIVLAFLGASFNGLLSVGHKFSSLFMTLYNIFNLSWTESASLHMNDSDREEFFSGVITNMFNLFMCLAVGIIACMPFVFPIMINKNFAGAYDIIPIFMLASMFNVVIGLYSVIYVALRKTKEIAKTSIYSGIINIIVHLILIRFIGLYASAVSTVIAFGIMAFYRYFDLKKYIKITLPVKCVFIILAMYVITTLSYYSHSIIFQGITLVLDIIISIIMNKSMVLEGIKFIKKYIIKSF